MTASALDEICVCWSLQLPTESINTQLNVVFLVEDFMLKKLSHANLVNFLIRYVSNMKSTMK
jgi:hypothetical protein